MYLYNKKYNVILDIKMKVCCYLVHLAHDSAKSTKYQFTFIFMSNLASYLLLYKVHF